LEPVHEASLNDLDEELMNSYIERVIGAHPKAFERLERKEILRRLKVAVPVEGVLCPTLAALLVFGLYPQQFFPQLSLTFVSVPGTQIGDLGPNGERFLDSVTCEGPIPTMVVEATHALTRNMARASIVSGLGREERLEYPFEVIRELLMNAIMHRDYSPGARGSQIQVELYMDRLVVRSPGGIYGPVDPSDFGEPDVSSSRNATLARMLEDTKAVDSSRMLAENRGSGIPTVLHSLHSAGMAPPRFDDNIRRLQVTVPHDSLLSPDTLEWITDLGQEDLSQAQVQALAIMKDGGAVRNRMLQNWGIHSTDATRALNDLVGRGLAHKRGGGRGSSYVLAPTFDSSRTLTTVLTVRQREILKLLSGLGETGPGVLSKKLGTSRSTLHNELVEMISMHLVRGIGVAKSPNRRYVLTQAGQERAKRM
ncbi:MAG: ATP-binding protein, partial [Scrofimicrobium sp.]